MLDALNYEFMQNALLAGLFASIICGIMGSLVVVNRIVFLAGGIAHAAFGGIGLAFFLGLPFLPVTLLFSLCAAFIMAMVSLGAKHRSDTIIGVIWAVGMALGIILLDLTPGYNVDLMSYLFGSILTVPDSDIYLLAGAGIFITGLVIIFYNSILAVSYDSEFARIRGLPVKSLYLIQTGLLAVTIVLIIQIVGLILVIALLTIPPFIVEKYTRSLLAMMAGSAVLGSVFTVIGLYLSFKYNLSSGASIILVAGVSFFLVLFIEAIRKRFNSRHF